MVYTVKALHSNNFLFWSMRSLRGALIAVVLLVVSLLMLPLFLGDLGFALVFYAAVVILAVYGIYMVIANFVDTRMLSLTISLSMLQLLTLLSVVFLIVAFLAYVNDKREDRQNRRSREII